MNERQLGGGGGGGELPVPFEANAQEKPVQPRQVVGQQQNRPGCVQGRLIVRGEAEQQAEQQAGKAQHQREERKGNGGTESGARFVSRSRCRAPASHSTPETRSITPTTRNPMVRL